MNALIEPLFDPVSRWLAQKIRFDNSLVAVSVGLFAGITVYILVPAIDGVLLPSSSYISSLEAWPLIYVWLITVPLIFGYHFCWQPNNVNETFLSLVNGDIFTGSKNQITSTIKKKWSSFAQKPWWLVAVGLALIGTTLHAMDSFNHPISGRIWYTINPISFYLGRAPFVFLSIYMVAQIFIRHIGFILTLRELFKKFEVKIIVLHPDNSGGLGSLGKHSLFMSAFLSIIALNIVAIFVTVNLIYQAKSSLAEPSSVIMMVSYLVLSPLIFFLPLSIAHKQMEHAKKSALLEISQRVRELFEQSQQLLPKNGTIKDLSEELESLEKLYILAKKFPVWPFDVDTLSRFVATIILPFIPSALIEIILQAIF